MSDSVATPLTPKEDCEECKNLRDRADAARRAKSYLTGGYGTGYRPEKPRSRQYKQVREQLNRDENAERLARAQLRLHELEAHEGITDSNVWEYRDCMTIVIRGGRNSA